MQAVVVEQAVEVAVADTNDVVVVAVVVVVWGQRHLWLDKQ